MSPRKHSATGASRRGLGTTRAIAALGLVFAARSACPSGAERSDGPYCRGPFWPCREAQGTGRACAEGHTPSLTDSLRLFERSAKARSEFRSAPRERASQVAPARSVGVTDSRVALSLVTFFRRSERKLLRRRAHTPAPARKASKKLECGFSPSPCLAPPHRSPTNRTLTPIIRLYMARSPALRPGFEGQINNRRGEQGQQLAQDQPAHHRDP